MLVRDLVDEVGDFSDVGGRRGHEQGRDEGLDAATVWGVYVGRWKRVLLLNDLCNLNGFSDVLAVGELNDGKRMGDAKGARRRALDTK